MATIETTILRRDDGLAYGVQWDVAGHSPIIVTLDMLTGAMAAESACHGLKQKCGDAAAIARNPDTGASATAEEKWDAIREIAERVTSGRWNAARGEATSGKGLLYTALERLFPTMDVADYLKAKSAKDKSDLSRSSRIAPVIAEIKAEREARKAANKPAEGRAAALLAELDALNG